MRRGRWEKTDDEEPEDHAIGRSRGGLSCKIHILCDALGHPLHAHLSAGQAHEASVFDTLMVGTDEQFLDAHGDAVAWP